MSKPKVLLTRRIPSATLATLEAACEVDRNDGAPLPPAELVDCLQGKAGVVCVLTDAMTREVMASAPTLKVIANIAVGYNNIDVKAAHDLGIVVTNTPDVLTEATAELTWALVLDVTRRITEGDRLARRGDWKGWALDFMLGSELRGKQLGLVGVGRIGRAVAARAPAFGMKVAYTSRRMGKDVTDVVAFDLLKGGAANTPDPNAPATNTTTTAPPEDPKVTKAVETARKAAKAKALDAWKAVLVLDAAHSEAAFRIAAIHAGAKQPADALAQLDTLAKSTRADAIEWLVEARFDPAFAPIRADAKFRTAVGLDRKPTSLYERVMGFGGQWEQNGTSCDKPEVKLVLKRDRNFTLRVKTRCQGMVDDTPFKGLWRVEGTKVVLAFPTRGKATAADESPCVFEASGDEDALRCSLGRDLDFVVLPARR